MKISKKAYYGLRAVTALAQAKQALSIRTLAKMEKLPEYYLEKILQGLRKASIVKSQKGVMGGYVLARETKNINVWEVLRELDEPIKPFAPPIKDTLPCTHPSHCQTNQIWRVLEKEIKTTLSNITLDKLLQQ